MANHGTETNQFMSNLPLTSSHPHPTVSNPEDDQSMSDLLWTSSHTHSTLGGPGYQLMDIDELNRLLWNDSGDSGVKDADELPSSVLAADAAAVAESGQPASGLRGEHSLPTSAAVANKLPPARMELLDGVCRDQSLLDISTSAARAMHHAGALDDDGIRGPHPAQGLFQPYTGTVNIRNPGPFYAKLKEIRHLNPILEAAGLHPISEAGIIREMIILFNQEKSISNDCKDYLVDPLEPPTSIQCYFTRFVALAKLDDDKKDKKADDNKKAGYWKDKKADDNKKAGYWKDKKDKKADDNEKAGYWKEKEAKAIRDPASRNIIGIKRMLEFMNGRKRTHWLADEYVALEPSGHDAVHILDDIVYRRVYEEAKETAPPSKCSKTGAHSSGESYIWQHMTRVYAGSTEAPSLLYGICHECDKALKCPPNFGNGNLNKHLARVHDIHPPCKNQCMMTEEKGVGRRAVRV